VSFQAPGSGLLNPVDVQRCKHPEPSQTCAVSSDGKDAARLH